MDYSQKKVIFVTGSLCDGGAERVLSVLASGCAELGADVTLVVLRDKKRIYPVSDKVKCEFIYSSGKTATFQRIRQLHAIFKRSDAEAIIPFVQIVTLYTLIANIGVGKKIIMSERSDPNLSIFSRNLGIKDKIGKFLIQTVGLHKLAYWTVFQTPDAQKWYGRKVRERSCIIPNPLNTKLLPQRFEGESEKRIVAAGRLVNGKNFSMLIHGFEIFHRQHPEFALMLYGEGEMRGELEALVKELNMDNYIYLPGFSENLQNDIRKATAYVSTSNYEGISNSMLEALGMGIPSIVTDCPVGGARMFVHTDENGILIPMNDVGALATAMSKIADNPIYANGLSLEAIKIREELCEKKISALWLNLI